MEITNKIAIVTGGASGLGFATASALTASGAKVAIVDLNAAATKTAAQQLNATAFCCDVADAEDSEMVFDAISTSLGTPHILINCAGIAPGKRVVGRTGPMPLADFEHVIRVNLTGTFNWLRLAANGMTKNNPDENGERGIIINTASVSAYEGQIGQAAYAAAKGGVAAMTLPVARELADYGIRVTAIAPGLMGTAMVAGMTEQVQKSVMDMIPFPRRFGKPEEFADLALTMIRNTLINGSVHRLDGALRMQG